MTISSIITAWMDIPARLLINLNHPIKDNIIRKELKLRGLTRIGSMVEAHWVSSTLHGQIKGFELGWEQAILYCIQNPESVTEIKRVSRNSIRRRLVADRKAMRNPI